MKIELLSKNFTLSELCDSLTAAKYGINNEPCPLYESNLEELAVRVLQPIRDMVGMPIQISSGYRSAKLNKLVGGSSTSAHRYGYAADIVCSDMRLLQRKVLEWAKNNPFDQIIIEQPTNRVASWVHAGWKKGSDSSQRKQILVGVKVNGKWSYRPITKEYYWV